MRSECHLAKRLIGEQVAIQVDVCVVLDGEWGWHDDEAPGDEDEWLLKVFKELNFIDGRHDWWRRAR